jgi:hypothetical protein
VDDPPRWARRPLSEVIAARVRRSGLALLAAGVIAAGCRARPPRRYPCSTCCLGGARARRAEAERADDGAAAAVFGRAADLFAALAMPFRTAPRPTASA